MNNCITLIVIIFLSITGAHFACRAEESKNGKSGLQPEVGPFYWVTAYDEIQVHRLMLLSKHIDPHALATALIVGPARISCISVEGDKKLAQYAVRLITSVISQSGTHEIREESVALSKKDAEAIHDLWVAQLKDVRIQRDVPMVTDALEYHFGAYVGDQIVCATTSSSAQESAVAEVWSMIKVTDTLSSLAACPAIEREKYLADLHSILK